MTDQPSSSPVPGELISAHLDGELDDVEAAHVARSIGADPALARHADELSTVRTLVRDLPPVDPPFGVIERIVLDLRRFRPSRTMAAATWAAAAAAVVLVVAVAPSVSPPEVAPDVDELAARQEVVATEPIASVRSADDSYEPVPVDEVSAEVPDELGGAEATAAYEAEDVTQVVYGEGADATSVFLQDGEVDWSELDELGGERGTVAGDPAWRSSVPPTTGRGATEELLEVVVVDRSGVVVVVVAPVVSDAAEADLDEFEDPPTSWSDDLVDSCGGVAETFGFEL